VIVGLGFSQTTYCVITCPSDMREPQHKPIVEVGEDQEATELGHYLQCCPIMNELDLSWIHMRTLLIQYVSQILNYFHVEGTLLQIGI
jgi:hypothetical protein